MEESGKLPCIFCECCLIEPDSGAYPHLRCGLCYRDIVFNENNENNEMEVMKWCPKIKKASNRILQN